MSPRFTNITASDIVKVLNKLGYVEDRQRGSHVIYYHPSTHQRVVISIHGRTVIKPKTLRSILKDKGSYKGAYRLRVRLPRICKFLHKLEILSIVGRKDS